jgi:hypothetical protein
MLRKMLVLKLERAGLSKKARMEGSFFFFW